MYYVIYPVFYLLSLLPLRILFLLSDFLYFILYRVVGYRKDVVMSNLEIAFPEKSPAERKKIAKDFYKNFVDSFLETIKMVSASEQYILDRFSMDASIANMVQAGGSNCQFVAGHNFNWEWSIWVISKQVKSKMMVAYMPITNKALERIYYNFRSRHGCILLPATSFTKAMLPYRKTQLAMTMVGDQNPGSPHNSWWVNFFGKQTPFLTGPEKNAKLFKAPVIYVEFHRVKRGYYEGRMEMLAENPNELPEGEITIRFARKLEKVIREHPHNWLWSHRRWKFEWKDEYMKMRLEEPLDVNASKVPA